MKKNTLGELIEKAKGEDRSLREYARDAGVDVATLSKMKNGSYVPRKTEIYQSLTSPKAAPRGGVTCQEMLDASDFSRSFQKGFDSGFVSVIESINAFANTEAHLRSILAILKILKEVMPDESLDENDVKKAKDLQVKKSLQFEAMAKGLVIDKLSEMDIKFRAKNTKSSGESINSYFEIEDPNIHLYGLIYAYIEEKQSQNTELLEALTRPLLGNLVFVWPNEVKKKISIITNSEIFAKELCKYRNKLALNANVSVVLIDENSVGIKKESFISKYIGSETVEELLMS